MSDPIVTPADLALYFNDPSIDVARAESLIADAQQLCESVLSPLPAGAAIVVKRIAARAYVTILSPRQKQLAAAGSPYAGNGGAVYMMDGDVADLRRLGGGGGTFSVDLLPANYQAPASWPGLDGWDSVTTA